MDGHGGTPQGSIVSPILWERSYKIGNLMIMGTRAAACDALQGSQNVRDQMPASIASNSSCTPLNMPF